MAESSRTSAIKILVVDDSATDRLILQKLLRLQGHEVLAASSGAEAIELYQSEQPALILLDALMPGMDGFEVAERVKRLAADEFIPIIFLTSLQDADSLARCLDAGGDDFLSKPYNSVILQAKINAFNRMRAMHHTLLQQRDQIASHNSYMLHEQEGAKKVFDKVAHSGCLDAANIKYSISPIAVFNGDIILAGITTQGNLMVLLGDFTGHGLHAALGAMPLAQTFYGMLEKGFNQRDILREINRKLHEILPVGVFCCALLAELDFDAGSLYVWNGGLPDCVLFRPEPDGKGQLTRLPSRHVPLGIKSAASFSDVLEFHEIAVGDRLYFWSDGILEVNNEDGDMFGELRLFQLFYDNREPDSLFNEINIAVNSYIGESGADDDLSLLEVLVVPPAYFKPIQPRYSDSDADCPNDWALSYTLNTISLRDFNPLPLMMQLLMQVPALRPCGGQIYTVLTELYSNALEHGVLGLSSSLKSSPEGFARYYRQRGEALAALERGSIRFDFNYRGDDDGGRLTLGLSDSGAGFDIEARQRSFKDGSYSGRGMSLITEICHSLRYLGCGNQVEVVFVWGLQAAEDTDSSAS